MQDLYKKKIWDYSFIFLSLIQLIIYWMAGFNTGLIPDEFQVGHFVENIVQGLVPYRDYSPYKNVLGYYFLSFFQKNFETSVDTIIFFRFFLSSIFTLCFFLLIREFRKVFGNLAAFLSHFCYFSLIFLSANTAQYRQDSLSASILCIISIFLLKNRLYWAGFLISLSFLISQKAAFWVFAIGLSHLVTLLKSKSDRTQSSLVRLLKFYALMLLPVIVYYSWAWSISDAGKIAQDSLQSPLKMGGSLMYLKETFLFWKTSLKTNPIQWLLIFSASLYSLIFHIKESKSQYSELRGFATFLAIFMFINPSAWPYTFLNFLPASILLIGISMYTASEYLPKKKSRKVFVYAILFTGLLVPCFQLRFLFYNYNEKERLNLSLADEILNSNDSYIAASNYLFKKKTSLPNHWIDSKFKIRSQNWSDEQLNEYLQKVENIGPYLVVNCDRLIRNTPSGFHDYLKQNFSHYWSALYTRTFIINRNIQNFKPKKGRYKIRFLNGNENLKIDGLEYKDGDYVFIKKSISIQVDKLVSLQWFPMIPDFYREYDKYQKPDQISSYSGIE
ncbi:MAG: hypothetical protein CL674_16965 [Bdellovibrionaceae bacterium]|nr:hypothetical protein [Pseudobdellovibrionaceae bacterium]|tara:strand:- start:34145 stop:35821 length:1677 start_codon:yes stop_codon:yes gene_type:complete